MKIITIAIIIIMLLLCFSALCVCRAAGMADRQAEKLLKSGYISEETNALQKNP